MASINLMKKPEIIEIARGVTVEVEVIDKKGKRLAKVSKGAKVDVAARKKTEEGK